MEVIWGTLCVRYHRVYRGEDYSTLTTAMWWEIKILFLHRVRDLYGPDLKLCEKDVDPYGSRSYSKHLNLILIIEIGA